MNKIFKVIYSKTRHCYVVVSELAKSHCKTTQSHTVRSKTALTAAVLLALGAFSFVGMPVAQAADGTESLRNNDFVGANDKYWYYDEGDQEWKTYQYKLTSAFNNRARGKLPNYQGGGAKLPGAITAGLYAQAGQQTVTIGDRNAGQSKGSVFIGEHSGYNNGDNAPAGMKNNYVTSVGFQSDATGWGSIAIGSNATAENSKMESQVVEEVGDAHTSGTVSDDTYGIKENPIIQGASVALGYSATAKDGNIAIGANSVATAAASNLGTAKFREASAGDYNAPSSYISVGSDTVKRRITNVAAGSDANDVATVGQLSYVEQEAKAKGSWKLTAGGTNESTVEAGSTVDFSAGSDGNLSVSKDKTSNKVTIGLKKDVILGKAAQGEGGSLSVYQDPSSAGQENGNDQLGSHVRIDGSTVSIRYQNGTKDSDARGVVLGVAKDSSNPLGYMYLADGNNHYYVHGTMANDPKALQGRLVYNSSLTGYNYIANLDDGITFTGDVQKDVPKDYTQTPTKLNTTLNITGGAKTEKDLTSGNIGVVSTPAAEKADGTTQDSKLEIKLNKDLKGITSITSQTSTNSTGAKIKLGENGTTISGGDVNVSNNKVTGLADGTISDKSTDAITGKQLNAVKTDLTKNLTVNAGWGLKKEGNTISLERNLGKNYGVTKNSNSKGKVTFETQGKNSLILGGSAINDTWYAYENDKNKYLDHAYGTFQDDSVLVGGENNATGTKDEENSSREKGSVVVGGRYNTASGYYTLINGGSHNITNGDYSAILGGYKNEVQKSDWAGYSTIVGGAYNIASGTGATAVGGGDDINSDYPIKNIASGSYSTTVGGKGNQASGKLSVTVGGEQNKADGWETVVIGGFNNEALSYYGNQSRGKQPFTEGAIVVGGQNNKNSGRNSSIFGGNSNLISVNAVTASIVGGTNNFASGDYTTVGGGQGNVVLGDYSAAFGGFQSIVNGYRSTGIAGGSTESRADLSLAAGYQSTVTSNAIGWEYLSVTEEEYKNLMTEMQSGKMSGYYQYAGHSDGKYDVLHYKDISTALGYQATADESGTIALGHDKGDTFLIYKWQQKAWKDGNSYYTRNINTGGVKEISEEEYKKLRNSDGTWNDYTISPNVERGTYDTAYYNRLVKAADGQDAHDVVVREQLTPYTKSDATNIGANLKTYTVGNDGETITEADASDADKTVNENAWGTAIGNGKIADPTKSDTNDPEANGSKQLVTGGTVYSYNKPVAVSADKPLKYVKEGKTTGENLGILDATLNDKNHNIKYYAVDETTLPKLTNFNGKDYSNEKNDGAKGMGSMAAGFNTHADGIASTVAGSYSGVINADGTSGLNGATALSYGTFNINQNTDTSKLVSGVANSIIGQANVTENSNAAIIYGAGNTVTNSYRDITVPSESEVDLGKVEADIKKNDMAAVIKDLQTAVPQSGGQVMVMGGGNNVDNAYMTQVNGVSNTVQGSGTEYDADSTQLNYIEGFYSKLENGKNDYIIGAHNTVTGKTTAQNQSNIVFGDNHKLTNTKNNLILGSSDTADDETTVSDVVSIGHNAKVSAEGGVAIGSGSEATVAGKTVTGYDPTTGAASTTETAVWKATNGAVSVGKADGSVTRQINGLAAGIKDTDAVNVAQLKKLGEAVQSNTEKGLAGKANVKADNIGAKLKDANGNPASANDIKDNEDAWGTAIGTGKVAKENGQLVTGKTVYDALHGGLDDIVIGHDGKDGKAGSIGLVGPKGQDGKDGLTTTIIRTETGAAGVDGKDGKDGKDRITRIVYGEKDNPNDKHTVATLDDGMKYAGDTGDAANVKLNHQMKLSGTTFSEDKKYDAKDWTSDNIAVVSNAVDSDGNAVMNLKLAKNLKGLNSSTYTTTETTGEGDQKQTTDYTTTVDSTGVTIKSTTTKDGKTETVNGPSITKDGINGGGKQITNIGDGITADSNGKYTVTDQNKGNAANISDVQNIVNDAKKDLTDGANGLNRKANVDASNIGENLKDAKGNKASADEITTNKNAWASAIGTDKVEKGNKQLVTSDAVAQALDGKADKSYVDQELNKKADKSYVDDQLDTKANKSDVYTKDETYSKTEVDSKVTDITKGLDGKANKDLGNIDDKGKAVIRDLAKGSVKVINGTNTKVSIGTEGDATTYAVDVEGNGKVASGDTGLISGGTLYKEVHVDKDGSYIQSGQTVAQNLSSLDTGLKTTSDLIHTNDKGDTIQIGGNSTATKIDVSGKDDKGRVITGVVSDANDPNSAANVGYVNDVTAASTQQVYRDMNRAYGSLNNNINRAAAGSNALAALHPLDFDPADKASFAFGYGHYRNANAGAFGAFYQPNANTMVNFGITVGNGDPGFNAGVSFKIGKGSAYNGVSKAEMAQTIHDQATEISAIKADDAAKDKRIDALEKENKEMKKQIQEILARLNG